MSAEASRLLRLRAEVAERERAGLWLMAWWYEEQLMACAAFIIGEGC